MWEDPRVSIGSIQRILGHESSKTTEIYLHSIGEADREAMEIFEEKSEVVEIVEEKKSDGE
jgi:integrase